MKLRKVEFFLYFFKGHKFNKGASQN